MHKRAFEDLKRTFMHFSSLPHHILILKKYSIIWLFKSKYGSGRLETCIKMRFKSWNALLYISQVFHHHNLIEKKEQKLDEKSFSFKIKTWWGRSKNNVRLWIASLCMSQVFSTIFHLKTTIYKVFCFFRSKYGGGRPETYISVRLRTWNSRFCISQVFLLHILIEKKSKNLTKKNFFKSKHDGKQRVWKFQVFPLHILI